MNFFPHENLQHERCRHHFYQPSNIPSYPVVNPIDPKFQRFYKNPEYQPCHKPTRNMMNIQPIQNYVCQAKDFMEYQKNMFKKKQEEELKSIA